MEISDNGILVKNLPSRIYVAELCNAFSYGNILSVVIQADGERKSAWEAYITYEDSFSAVTAFKHMNNRKVRGKTLKVVLSSVNEHFRKVFVKNFSPSWDLCDLLKAFEDVGTIEDAKISESNGKSNGYGYLIFRTHCTAERAVECMNGKVIDGHKLLVERFKCKTERETLTKNSFDHVEEMLRKSTQRNNLYVKNLPASMTEDKFRKLFQKFGEVTSVKIETYENGASKGFGFVCFSKIEDAEKALKRMNGLSVEGKKLEINFKEDGNLRKQYMSLKNKSREAEIRQYKQRSQSVPKLIPHPLMSRK